MRRRESESDARERRRTEAIAWVTFRWVFGLFAVFYLAARFIGRIT